MVSFNVSADAYLRFMGRYSEPLAAQFADLAGARGGQRLLDVGCGPGALTAELVKRVGPDAVSAVEPSASFVAAARERLGVPPHEPEVGIRADVKAHHANLPSPTGRGHGTRHQPWLLSLAPGGADGALALSSGACCARSRRHNAMEPQFQYVLTR